MKIFLLAFLVVAILAFAGYIAYQNRQILSSFYSQTIVNNPEPVDLDPSPTTVASRTKEFTITGSNFRFNPAEIRVNQGDQIKIIFKNTGGTHDWKLDDFNIETSALRAGEQETVSFVANKKGTFEYYCSVNNHRQMGMVGNLIVE